MNRSWMCLARLGVAVLAAMSTGRSFAAPQPLDDVTVIAHGQVTRLPQALVEGQALWIPADRVTEVTGLELKPQGVCLGAYCLPWPAEQRSLVQLEQAGQSWVSLTKLAGLLEQVVEAVPAERVWSFGEVPQAVAATQQTGVAPDVTVPDRTGRPVQLSQFRGKKVLLLTWASWCGCSRDLPGWQKVYDELRDHNFELVAVAEDSGGEEAAGKFYDRAQATFTTLIDPQHVVSTAYHMVNVPMGVWIDEAGSLVRPPEVAYTTQKFMGVDVGGDRYLAALRDWVRRGSESPFVLTAEARRAAQPPQTPELQRADVCFHLGVYFQQAGRDALANEYWERAQKLNPDNWNYHRQDWAFTPQQANGNWLKKYQSLGGKPYYQPLDLPAVAP